MGNISWFKGNASDLYLADNWFTFQLVDRHGFPQYLQMNARTGI
jgi:hypothetical protein